jgi:hypothetical protein
MFDSDNNPYQSPKGGNSKSTADWRLFKVFCRVVGIWILILIFCDVALYLQYQRISKRTAGEADARAAANWMTDF